MDRTDLAHMIAARLAGDRARLAEAYANPTGTTTRHAIIDGVLPGEVASRIADAFGPADAHFQRRDTFRERKRTCTALDLLDPILKEISFALQQPAVLAEVAAITAMASLEPDASLYAGGLSIMGRGDFLNPHVDNSHDAARERYRRINLLYYVTPDWREENGGNLELWDEQVKNPKTLDSVFNRLVLMETNRTSWHSVSPVTVEAQRCCVSSYYFSAVSPDMTDYFHVTGFTARPEQPLRRALSDVDAAARNFAGGVLGLGRGRDKVYKI